MAFLTLTDYKPKVKDEVLAILQRNDESIRETAETYAKSQMIGYLSTRYDTDAIFSATGNDRDPIIVMYMVEIALYHLFSTPASSRKMPSRIEMRFEHAIDWLEKVRDGEISPALPKLEDTAQNNVLHGSNTKRNLHF